MHVVYEHEQPALGGERIKKAGSVIEQPQPLFGGRQCGIGRQRPQLGLNFGRELGYLRRSAC